jgi:hypothetical protein
MKKRHRLTAVTFFVFDPPTHPQQKLPLIARLRIAMNRGLCPLKPPPLAGEAGEQKEFCYPAKQGIKREGVKG